MNAWYSKEAVRNEVIHCLYMMIFSFSAPRAAPEIPVKAYTKSNESKDVRLQVFKNFYISIFSKLFHSYIFLNNKKIVEFESLIGFQNNSEINL